MILRLLKPHSAGPGAKVFTCATASTRLSASHLPAPSPEEGSPAVDRYT